MSSTAESRLTQGLFNKPHWLQEPYKRFYVLSGATFEVIFALCAVDSCCDQYLKCFWAPLANSLIEANKFLRLKNFIDSYLQNRNAKSFWCIRNFGINGHLHFWLNKMTTLAQTITIKCRFYLGSLFTIWD